MSLDHGGGGVTAPDQRIEAACRLIPGGPVKRATEPPWPRWEPLVRKAARQPVEGGRPVPVSG
jgi:hypothetical protein